MGVCTRVAWDFYLWTGSFTFESFGSGSTWTAAGKESIERMEWDSKGTAAQATYRYALENVSLARCAR